MNPNAACSMFVSGIRPPELATAELPPGTGE